MTTLLPIQSSSLQPNQCFADEQSRLNAFAAAMQAVLSGGLAFFNYGDSKPIPENQGYPWFRTVDCRWYYFNGKWKTPVPSYDINERRLYAGALADLVTYDGGDNGASSTESGPMWLEDTAFIGRSPMHPGLIPETVSFFAKTLLVGENYGDGSHAQTTQEMAVHSHTPDPTKADAFLGHTVLGAPATYNVTSGGDTIALPQTATAGGNGLTPSVTQAASLVQPVRGIYLIKRSVRLFYVVP